jgi:hypothetical protein
MAEQLLVGSRKGLFFLQRVGGGQATWQIADTAFLGDPVTMVLAVPETGRLYAALDHGHFGVKLHCSEDNGRHWTETTAPEYPPKPEDADETDPFSGQPIPWTLKRIWSLAASPGGGLWCGTMPGGLFRSANSGGHWELVRSLWDHPARLKWAGGGADWPGIHSLLVDPRDPDHLTVGVSVGGVWTTFDGGGSWETRTEGMWAAYMPPESAGEPAAQDPHCVVQCPAAPDVFWCQHHNGVFRSTDGGGSWQDIKSVQPSVFGFAVAVHPHDPDTAWLIPAIKDEQRIPVDGRLVVARTRNAGASFEVLGNGLPQAHAYDLIYRHALDVDSSGERLAFGSTTGGLWSSDNGGDSWQEISAHLPPIYCVRFT